MPILVHFANFNSSPWPPSIPVCGRYRYRYVADIDIGTCPTSISVHCQHQYRYVADIDVGTWPTSMSIRARHRYRYMPDIDIGTCPTSILVCVRHRYRYVADIDISMWLPSIPVHSRHRYRYGTDFNIGTWPTSTPVRYRHRHQYVTDVDTGMLPTSIPYQHRFDSGSFVPTVIDTLLTCCYRFKVNFRSVPFTYKQSTKNKRITNNTKYHYDINVTFMNKKIKINTNNKVEDCSTCVQVHSIYKPKNSEYISLITCAFLYFFVYKKSNNL
jgi:hypothetical protein